MSDKEPYYVAELLCTNGQVVCGMGKTEAEALAELATAVALVNDECAKNAKHCWCIKASQNGDYFERDAFWDWDGPDDKPIEQCCKCKTIRRNDNEDGNA